MTDAGVDAGDGDGDGDGDMDGGVDAGPTGAPEVSLSINGDESDLLVPLGMNTVTVEWSSTDADSCTLSQNTTSEPVNTNGTRTNVLIEETTLFELVCTNAFGPSEVAIEVAVEVQPPFMTLTVNGMDTSESPTNVANGEDLSFLATTQYAAECELFITELDGTETSEIGTLLGPLDSQTVTFNIVVSDAGRDDSYRVRCTGDGDDNVADSNVIETQVVFLDDLVTVTTDPPDDDGVYDVNETVTLTATGGNLPMNCTASDETTALPLDPPLEGDELVTTYMVPAGISTVTFRCPTLGGEETTSVDVAAMEAAFTSPANNAVLPYGGLPSLGYTVSGAEQCEIRINGAVQGDRIIGLGNGEEVTGTFGALTPLSAQTTYVLFCRVDDMMSAFVQLASVTVNPSVEISAFDLVWDEDGGLAPLRLTWTAVPPTEAICTVTATDGSGGMGDDEGNAMGSFLPSAVAPPGATGAWTFALSCEGPGPDDTVEAPETFTVWLGDANTADYNVGALQNLDAIDGSVVLNDSINTNDLSRLSGTPFIAGTLTVNTAGELQNINGSDMAALTHLGGLSASNNTALSTAVFSALTTVSGSIDVSTNGVLQTVSMVALTSIGSNLTVSNNGRGTGAQQLLDQIIIGPQSSGAASFSINGGLTVSNNGWLPAGADATNPGDLRMNELDSIDGTLTISLNDGMDQWAFADLTTVANAFQSFTVLNNAQMACAGGPPSADALFCGLVPQLSDDADNIGNNSGCAGGFTPTCE